MMLKKKPSERKDSGGVRPESPNGDGRTRRRARPTVPRVALGKKHYYRSRSDVRRFSFLNSVVKLKEEM